MANPDKILIVDDDLEICKLLSMSLSPLGYEIASANDGFQALELVDTERFEVVILDLMLPGPDGIEILNHIREQGLGLEVIVLTAYASLESAIEAVRLGAYDYVTKPFNIETIRSTVRRALEKQRLAARLAAIHDLSREMALLLDVDQVTGAVLDIAGRVLECEIRSLWLVDEEQNELYLLAARGIEQEAIIPRLPLNSEQGITVAAVRSGESIYVPDVRDDPNYVAIETANLSELVAPLQVKDRVIGVLNIEGAEVDAFSPEDEQLLSTLAAQAAVAIENARLYEAEQEQRRLVEQSQAQLVQSEKLAATGRLAASLAHEINNPFQAIHNSLQILLHFSLEPDEQQEYLQIADEEVKRLIALTERILNFARRPRRKMKPTNLNEVIEKTLALGNQYSQHRHIVLQHDLSPDLPLTMAAPDELGQVFLNLLINAVDAMPEGGTLHVSSRLADDGRRAVAFSDTGCGIPYEHLDRIFEPFFSTKEGGAGLGLSVSYSVVERHGGEITIQSTEGEGTIFTVWLPAPPE